MSLMNRRSRVLSFLINEPPLTLSPSLARALGLNCALLIQQIHYWLEHKEQDPRAYSKPPHNFNGRYWVFWSHEEILERIPLGDSIKPVKLALGRLRGNGVLLAENNPENRLDRRLCYSIDYNRLQDVFAERIITFGTDAQAASGPVVRDQRSSSTGAKGLSVYRDNNKGNITGYTPSTLSFSEPEEGGGLCDPRDEPLSQQDELLLPPALDEYRPAIRRAAQSAGLTAAQTQQLADEFVGRLRETSAPRINLPARWLSRTATAILAGETSRWAKVGAADRHVRAAVPPAPPESPTRRLPREERDAMMRRAINQDSGIEGDDK